MNDRKRYSTAWSFWTLAAQYLFLVENAAHEIETKGNPYSLVKDYRDGEITSAEFTEKTQWSDHRIIMPLLFNLYHGLELMLKGFLLVHPEGDVEAKHSIQRLTQKFAELYPAEKDLQVFFRKYTALHEIPEILSEFLRSNGISIDQLYEALRYPVDRNFQRLKNYINLKYQGDAGVAFFRELWHDLSNARMPAVRLGRSMKPTNEVLNRREMG